MAGLLVSEKSLYLLHLSGELCRHLRRKLALETAYCRMHRLLNISAHPA